MHFGRVSERGTKNSIGAVALVLTLYLGGATGNLVEAQVSRPRPGAQPQRSTAPPPPPPGIFVEALPDQTAVMVGDQFHYMIRVEYSPEYEFVPENVTSETIKVEPFELIALQKEVTPQQNGNQRLTLDLTLASFIIGKASQQIPQVTLSYIRRNQAAPEATNTAPEALVIPGPEIGIRSILPPDPTRSNIRESITITPWPRSRWLVAIAGWVASAFLLVGLARESVIFIRGHRERRGRPDPRRAMRAIRTRWVGAVPSDFSNAQKAMQFYDQSYRDVKEFIGHFLETPTLGLTPEEMDIEMQRLAARPELTEGVVGALNKLEVVRYSPNGLAALQESGPAIVRQITETFDAALKR